MNYSKILNEVMKAAEKRDSKHKDFSWKWGTVDNIVGIIPPGGVSIIIIPPCHEYLNMKTVFKDARPFDLSKMFYDHRSDAEVLTDTHKSIARENGHVCHIFKNSKDEEIWVDENVLKPFADKDSEYIYKGKDKKSLVEIWTDGEELLGGVLPVNH